MKLAMAVLAVVLASPAVDAREGGQQHTAGQTPNAERVRELLVLAGSVHQSEILADQVIQLFRKQSPAVDPAFWEEMKAAIKAGAFLDLLVPIYQKHISAPDVEAAISYWNSDPGRRVAQAQPRILAESNQAGREWGARLFQEVAAKLKAAPARKLFTGYIDKAGKVVIEPRFRGPGQYSFAEGLARVEVDGKTRFIDKTGKDAFRPIFDTAYSFSDGLAVAYQSGKDYGFIDKTGAWAILPAFRHAESFSEGLALVATYRDGQRVASYIDKTGRVVVELKSDGRARSFHDELAAYEAGGKWGFIDRTGRVLAEPRFTRIRDVADGMAAVQLDDKWGFVDKTGRLAIEPAFELALDFAEGVAPVRRDGSWEYVDRAGRTAIPGAFELALPFTEGLATVRRGGKYGFIDRKGAVVIEPKFDDAGWFKEGLAVVKVGDKHGFIDKTGRVVIEPRFDRADEFSDGMAMIEAWK
jgi:hypothetical protein